MFFDLATFLKLLRLLLRPRTFSLRRLLVNSGFLVALVLINATTFVFQRLDHVFYPRLRHTKVVEPVFVIANPRSGTTFLHRLMCLDEERFTYIRLWQTVFASVTFYRMVGQLARVDRALGGPFDAFRRWTERKWFKGWDGVHQVGWNAAEEEEAIFVSSLLSPDALMIMPFPQEWPELAFLDALPEKKRKRVMRYFHDCVQRHVFATGNNRIYLSKNVFLSGRFKSFCETFPDARYVHLIRHPYSSLASTISMFRTPWQMHSPEIPPDSPESRYWADIGMDYYLYILENGEALAPGRFVTYQYDDLIADPRGVVHDIYKRLGIPMSEAFDARLTREAQLSRHYHSVHDYSMHEYGLTEDAVYERLRPVFERYGFAKYPGHDGEEQCVDASVGSHDASARRTETSRATIDDAAPEVAPA